MFCRRAALTAIVFCVASCGSGQPTSQGDSRPTSESPAASVPTSSSAESSPSAAETSPTPQSFEEVRSNISGTSVGGNNGGEDAEVQYSETIRKSDGSCRGWNDPDSSVHTAGLENGAPVAILDRTGNLIGSGRVLSSHWFDASDGDDNWTCVFVYKATINGTPPDDFQVKVADLPPWRAYPDPTDPGTFVASVDSDASPEAIEACRAPAQLRQGAGGITQASEPGTGETTAGTTGETESTPNPSVETTPSSGAELPVEWREVVKTYWSDALRQLCDAGLDVTVKRDCRPPGVGSDYVIKVVSADDPHVVLEDAGGVKEAASSLRPGAHVAVWVATGRPC